MLVSNILKIQGRKQGFSNKVMMSDYCWMLATDNPD